MGVASGRVGLAGGRFARQRFEDLFERSARGAGLANADPGGHQRRAAAPARPPGSLDGRAAVRAGRKGPEQPADPRLVRGSLGASDARGSGDAVDVRERPPGDGRVTSQRELESSTAAQRANFAGGPLGDDLSAMDEQYTRGARLDLAQNVRREDDRVVPAEVAHELAYVADLVRVQPGCGLVENDDGRPG